MDSITVWVQDNLDIVFFVYGLAFVLMGLVILVQPKKGSAFKIAEDLWLLASFGLTHGVNEWLDMWAIIKGRNETLDFARWFFVIISFFFLFEFGRRLFRSSLKRHSQFKENVVKINQFCFWWLAPVLGLLLVILSVRSVDFWKTGSILSRYFLCFPGSLVTGIGFFYYYHSEKETFNLIKIKGLFYWAGLSFLAYGILGGLFVPKGGFFPSNQLNADVFFSTVHIPVQFFRSITAVIVALAVGGMIRIFNWETTRKIQDTVKALWEKEERFRAIFETAQDSIFIKDCDLKYSFVNPAMENVFALPASKLIGLRDEDLFGENLGGYIREEDYRVLGGEVIEGEHTIPVKGILVSFHFIKVPIRDGSGKVAGICGIARDITERKRWEEILRESEEKFRNISTSAQDAIIMMNNDGNISYWNKAAERIFGYAGEEALGKEMHIFIGPERYHEAYMRGFSEFKETGEGPVIGKTLELEAVRKDGTEFPIELSISSVKISGRWNAIGIIRDITDRKQAAKKMGQVHFLNEGRASSVRRQVFIQACAFYKIETPKKPKSLCYTS